MTVDYLPIANGDGANVESQAQYVIDLNTGGSLQNGYQTGIMKSNQWNKSLRQSSMMTSALANFIASTLNENVLDDGNLSALIELLTSAIQSGGSQSLASCIFQQTSTTQVALFPKNGAAIRSSGVIYQTPASGLTAAATNVRVNGTPAQSLVGMCVCTGTLAGNTLTTSGATGLPAIGQTILGPGITPCHITAGSGTSWTFDGATQSVGPVTVLLIAAYLVSYNGVENELNYWLTSLYSHKPDTTAGNIGTEVITSSGTPQTSETVVGMVALDTSGHFTTGPLTLSWFNRDRKYARTGFSVTRSTTSGTVVEINPEIRNPLLTWDKTPVDWRLNGEFDESGGVTGVVAGVAFDGINLEPSISITVTAGGPLGLSDFTTLTEGPHYATVCGGSSGGTLAFPASFALSAGTAQTPTLLTVAAQG